MVVATGVVVATAVTPFPGGKGMWEYAIAFQSGCINLTKNYRRRVSAIKYTRLTGAPHCVVSQFNNIMSDSCSQVPKNIEETQTVIDNLGDESAIDKANIGARRRAWKCPQITCQQNLNTAIQTDPQSGEDRESDSDGYISVTGCEREGERSSIDKANIGARSRALKRQLIADQQKLNKAIQSGPQSGEDRESDSDGYISVTGCESEALTNSWISSGEDGIVYQNDLSDRDESFSGNSLSSIFKIDMGKIRNNNGITERILRSKRCTNPQNINSDKDLEDVSLYPKLHVCEEANKGAEECVMLSAGSGTTKNGNRKALGLMSKRRRHRRHSRKEMACYSRMLVSIAPINNNCSTKVKIQFADKEQCGLESDYAGVISVDGHIRRGDELSIDNNYIDMRRALKMQLRTDPQNLTKITQNVSQSEEDSNGYISVTGCESEASTNSWISSREDHIIYANDLSDRDETCSGSALSSVFKNNMEKKRNNNGKAESIWRSKGTNKGAQQCVIISAGSGKIKKGNRKTYGLVLKRRRHRRHSRKRISCYNRMLVFIAPINSRCSKKVKIHFVDEEQDDLESDSSGFLSVEGCISKDDNKDGVKILEKNVKHNQVGIDKPDVGSTENGHTENAKSKGQCKTKKQNPVKDMTASDTELVQWQECAGSVKGQMENNYYAYAEKGNTDIQASVSEDLGSEDFIRYNTDMTAKTITVKNSEVRDSQNSDESESSDFSMKRESRQNSFTGSEHALDTYFGEKLFLSERGQLLRLNNSFPPLPDHHHRDVHVVV